MLTLLGNLRVGSQEVAESECVCVCGVREVKEHTKKS